MKGIRLPIKASSFSPSDHLDTSYMYNWDLVSTVYKASSALTTAAFRCKIQLRNEIERHSDSARVIAPMTVHDRSESSRHQVLCSYIELS
jgi:hypothetical protein